MHSLTPMIRIALSAFALASLCNAQVSMGAEQLITQPSLFRSTAVEDLNNDGFPDILNDRLTLGKLRWFRSEDAGQRFEHAGVVSPLAPKTFTLAGMRVADLDGDGDMDAVYGTEVVGGFIWYENTDGLGTFGIGGRIPVDLTSPLVLDPIDFDGDGDVDLMTQFSIGGGLIGIAWIPNLDGLGSFGPAIPVLELTGSNNVERILLTDLTGDGLPDVINHWVHFETPRWFENLGIGEGFGAAQPFGEVGQRISGASDLDGDGDVDLLGHTFSRAVWLENADGAGGFVAAPTLHELEPPTALFSGMTSTDLDGDGDPDIVASAVGEAVLMCFENLDGSGTFGGPQFVAQEATSLIEPFDAELFARDMDADADQDIVLATSAGSAWFANEGGTLGAPIMMTQSLSSPRHADLRDVDADGDLDVVVGAIASGFPDVYFGWYEQLDEPGTFAPLRAHGTNDLSLDALSIDWISDRDFTGDGHADLAALAINFSGPQEPRGGVQFYEYDPDLHDFKPLNLIETGNTAGQIESGDLNGDGIEDVLVQLNPGSLGPGAPHQLAWARGSGAGAFEDLVVLFGSEELVSDYLITDVDADGDVDILGAVSGAIILHENLDGLGTFNPTAQTLVATPGSPFHQSVLDLVDLDDDGDDDIVRRTSLFGSTNGGVFWIENLAPGSYASEQALITGLGFVGDVGFEDLDGDGERDLTLTYGLAPQSVTSVGWMRGLGGGTFEPLQALSNMDHPGGAAVALAVGDVDADGSADIVLARTGGQAATWLRQGPRETPFTDLGGSLAGGFGAPKLTARGSMRPTERVELQLGTAAPTSPFFLVLGTELQATPFQGGVLIPTPDVVLAPRLTDGAGEFAWVFRVPTDFELFDHVLLQAWIADPTTAFGISASNALAATVLFE